LKKDQHRGRRVAQKSTNLLALAAKAKNLAGEPGIDRTAQSIELPGKEMIGSLKCDEMIIA
jgi:hypothetical protein